MIFIYVGMRLYQYSEDNFDCLKEVFAKKWKGVKHVDLTSLSIFQKTVTFDQNMTYIFYSLLSKILFVGIHILNEKV